MEGKIVIRERLEIERKRGHVYEKKNQKRNVTYYSGSNGNGTSYGLWG